MERPNESKSASSASAWMPFIVSSNIEKADPATRKLIRSHARRGKTHKRGRHTENHQAANMGTIARHTQIVRVELEDVVEFYTPLVPGRIGSDICFIEFPDEIDSSIVLNMAKVSSVAMKVIFPLITAIDFPRDNEGWIPLFGRDAAALHITAFAMQGFIDKVLRRQNIINPPAILHLQRGLKLLRERLLADDDEIKVSDSTMGLVLKLASTTHFNGDHQASKQHMEGLRKMVDLRGGLDVLRDKTFLVEMLRVDLGVALLNSSQPVFFRQPLEPVIEYPEKMLPAPDNKFYYPEDNIKLMGSLDNELARSWQVMRRFCLLVNLGTQTQRLIRLETIHETMTAVMYRLLRTSFAAGSIDETIRHGLLAFSYHVFLQWQDIVPPYHQFAAAYKSCILGVKSAGGIPSQLILWLLMAGAISIFDISEESWLRELIKEYTNICRIKTWKEMQDILKSYMWIVMLSEKVGKRIYSLLDLDRVGQAVD
ncbi:hypothetical protein F4776DRAFT_621013 [Hypoxylon sp. NC0597]|nr:hypothetical protein F4776DRAFT_621013 [Hypoxylon sp. NC0597]